MTTQEFRDALLLEIFAVKSRAEIKEYQLTDKDWEKVHQLKAQRFAN